MYFIFVANKNSYFKCSFSGVPWWLMFDPWPRNFICHGTAKKKENKLKKIYKYKIK